MKEDVEFFNEDNLSEIAFDKFCQILSALVDLKQFLVALMNSDRDAISNALDHFLGNFDLEDFKSEC